MHIPLALLSIALCSSCAWCRPAPPEYPEVCFESGVIVRDLVVPEAGELVRAGDTVSIRYQLLLGDRELVESSLDTGRELSFAVGGGQVPRGLEEGLVGMRRFGRRRIVIPPDLAYGSAGLPPSIPPDATITFEVELMEHLPGD